jgi:hypothetical protein
MFFTNSIITLYFRLKNFLSGFMVCSNKSENHSLFLFRNSMCFAFYCLLFGNTFAQNSTSGIENFHTYKTEGRVFVRFGISAGRTCDGITIRRSVEDGEFLSIREIEGICGSDSGIITYTEEDELPVFNRKLKYLLQLGRSAYSDTLNAFFTETGNSSYLIKSQATGWRIIFENPLEELFRLFVCDVYGKPLLNYETRHDFFEIPCIRLSSAPIFFRMFNSKSGLLGNGKLISFNP